EAKPDRGTVDDAVDYVIDLIPHDEIQKDDGRAFGQLFEDAGRIGRGRVGGWSWHQRGGEHKVPEAFRPDDQAGGDDGAPERGNQHEPPRLLLVAVEAADDKESDRGRRHARDGASGCDPWAGFLREGVD